jgi:hypothetical protein
MVTGFTEFGETEMELGAASNPTGSLPSSLWDSPIGRAF